MIVVRRGRSRIDASRASDLDELFRPLMSSRAQVRGSSRGGWRPALEVFETAEALEVVVELAGMKPDQIEIVIEGDVLSISGHRPDPSTCLHRSYHEARIPYGAFFADVLIPFPVEAEQTEAAYDNGFLNVRLPRTQGRTIVATRTRTDGDAKEGGNA
ncbi:MAG TPA: Hsp20/alpha crystallin family protein [Thermomicrobiales bacterium]|nr:Hsp20/alpha crystallin family protein [Thermomicrobiales bacterium]